ncbi:hypothetical protein GZH47_13755 [Paenibacillus rhizovicinus]|uniref:Uncharacterized protein n=1 Tax=Paenibacillus rhizovicinus TaxID=2704463 RepID=A0A6C0P013_9BACL|nr:hypothetical protein [Paenibacillus rhizovicinus]QHW31797.1 hypothetical protein GZH47_13755 [Paenibacillus rhizovicinus]
MKAKLKSKFIILSTIATISFGASVIPVSAADVPGNTAPSVSYGSTTYGSYIPIPLVLTENSWNTLGYDMRYDSWDKDTFNALNAAANVSLTTTSSSTYQISGSLEYGFSLIAKGTISGNWGETWGKTSTVTYNAEAGWTYELWSANQIKRLYWTYPKSSGGYLNSKSEGSNGTYKWFWRHH